MRTMERWPDKLARAAIGYYCVSGLIALALDAIHAAHAGEFVACSAYSIAAIRWLAPIGFGAALAAFVGVPRRLVLRLAAGLLCAVFAAAAALAWALR